MSISSKSFRNLIFMAAAAALLICPVAQAQIINSLFQKPKDEKKAGPASKSPTVITSDEMDIDMKGDIITLIDNVVIDEEGTNIKADKMVIHLKNAKNGEGDETAKEVKLIIATGNVVILKKATTAEEKAKGEQKATAGKADYDVESGTIVLTEDPVLFQGGSNIKGKKITVFRDSDRMKVEGGSALTFVPEDGAAADTSRKNPSPPPTVPPLVVQPPTSDSKQK